MADFYQSTTLCTLSSIGLEQEYSLKNILNRAIVIVIPCHVTHLNDKSIFLLLNALHAIDYLTEIVVVLNGEEHYDLKMINDLHAIDERNYILCAPIGKKSGKGFALNEGFSYVYEKFANEAIAVTLDADLKNFSLAFLTKLIYPLTEFAGDFNKGYYTRYSNNKLDGRLTRLLVFPLLHALLFQCANDALLTFLLEFRYPLSGDVAIRSHLIPKLSMQFDWSYDLSLLSEIYKNRAGLHLFQTEISQNYQHAHRSLDIESEHSLMRIAADIIRYLLTRYPINRKILIENYTQLAQCFMTKYERLALFNGLEFNRDNEMRLINQIITLLSNNSIV